MCNRCALGTLCYGLLTYFSFSVTYQREKSQEFVTVSISVDWQYGLIEDCKTTCYTNNYCGYFKLHTLYSTLYLGIGSASHYAVKLFVHECNDNSYLTKEKLLISPICNKEINLDFLEVFTKKFYFKKFWLDIIYF